MKTKLPAEQMSEIEIKVSEVFNRRRIKGTDSEYIQLKRSATALLRAAQRCQLENEYIQQISVLRHYIFGGRFFRGLRLVAVREGE